MVASDSDTPKKEAKEPNEPKEVKDAKTQNSADTSAMANEEPYSLVGKCFAEFIAVMIFVIIGSFQALTEFDGVLHAALAHGIAIFVLVSCFAHISGGHVNPAVTFGIALAGKIKWLEAGLYIVAQLLGGLVGSLLVRLMLIEHLRLPVFYNANNSKCSFKERQEIARTACL
ncbi:hypothetical protein Q1695_003150 [Nippostrongylus brasiliensis]|nr:hypothetical protein Q1695_003150 [Nippostrongylus brasiliensis]